MAITQKDIIDVIPELILDNSTRLLNTLNILAIHGWGCESELHKKLNRLTYDYECAKETPLKFDKEKWTLTPINCKFCWDQGYTLKSVGQLPCTECNVNVGANAA
jgi:hypothetical protein